MSSLPRFLPAVLLATLFHPGISSTSLAAEPVTYTLAKKNHQPPAGTTVVTETSWSSDGGTVQITARGETSVGTRNARGTATDQLVVLSPTRFRFTTTANSETSSSTLKGKKEASAGSPYPLLGTPLILQSNGSFWTAKLESGAKPDMQQQHLLTNLAASANQESDFHLYGGARRVGETWKVDPAKTGFGGIHEPTGDLSVKFLEVRNVGGIQCAILRITCDLKGKKGAGLNRWIIGGTTEVGLKGTATVTRSIPDLHNIRFEMDAIMTQKSTFAEKMDVHIKGPLKISRKATLSKP